MQEISSSEYAIDDNLSRFVWMPELPNERPLPYLASLINLGVNEVAARLHAVSPDLAHTFLGATYKPGKDYEKNEFRVDSWETVSRIMAITWSYPWEKDRRQ